MTDWAIAELKALKIVRERLSIRVTGPTPEQACESEAHTRGVQRLLARFRAHEIEPFTPHDLRRTGRTTLGRLGVRPFIAECVINHSKDVLQETYDLWDYLDEKRDALERLETYLLQLRDKEGGHWPQE